MDSWCKAERVRRPRDAELNTAIMYRENWLCEKATEELSS